jgi:hypothetical protein
MRLPCTTRWHVLHVDGVATSREDHRSPRLGRAFLHRRLGLGPIHAAIQFELDDVQRGRIIVQELVERT